MIQKLFFMRKVYFAVFTTMFFFWWLISHVYRCTNSKKKEPAFTTKFFHLKQVYALFRDKGFMIDEIAQQNIPALCQHKNQGIHLFMISYGHKLSRFNLNKSIWVFFYSTFMVFHLVISSSVYSGHIYSAYMSRINTILKMLEDIANFVKNKSHISEE